MISLSSRGKMRAHCLGCWYHSTLSCCFRNTLWSWVFRLQHKQVIMYWQRRKKVSPISKTLGTTETVSNLPPLVLAFQELKDLMSFSFILQLKTSVLSWERHIILSSSSLPAVPSASWQSSLFLSTENLIASISPCTRLHFQFYTIWIECSWPKNSRRAET